MLLRNYQCIAFAAGIAAVEQIVRRDSLLCLARFGRGSGAVRVRLIQREQISVTSAYYSIWRVKFTLDTLPSIADFFILLFRQYND